MSRFLRRKAPQTREELEDWVAEYGRELSGLETYIRISRDDLARLKKHQATGRRNRERKIAHLRRGIQTYCDANRDELTNNGKTKLIKLLNGGRIKWHMVKAAKLTRPVSKIVASLKRAGLEHLVRSQVKESVDKVAVKKNPAAISKIRGLDVVSEEAFTITPPPGD